MRYSQLGSTGVRVSAISLGTATFGVAPIAAEADGLIGHALDRGINVIDTANSYGNQARFDRPGAPSAAERASAEEIVGRALRGRRNDVVLCSKVMEPVGDGANEWGLSRRHILGQVESSLKRLGTDHLDVYYAHHPDGTTPIEETLRTFSDLIRQGKIRYYALSTYPGWQMMEALWKADTLGCPPPACVQVPYNFSRRAIESDVTPICTKYGISMTVFSPLAGGLFAGLSTEQLALAGHRRWGGPGFSEAQLSMAEQLQQIAQKSGQQPGALALQWLLSRPAVASLIVGAETAEQLDAAVDATELKLSSDLLDELDAIGREDVSFWSLL